MNKHAHRLVFDRRRGMRVPAHEHSRTAGKAAGGQTRAVVMTGALLLTGGQQLALAQDGSRAAGAVSATAVSHRDAAVALPPTARSVSSLVQAAMSATRSNLPTYSAGNWALNTGSYEDPTLSTDGKLMTLLQKGGSIVLNWDSFDIANGYTMQFVQPEGGRAINRVRNGTASILDGILSANSEVMIDNTAGIIFGKNARINVGSLTATALKISEAVTDKGLAANRKGEVAFGGDESAVAGFVAVQKGAEITALPGGRVVMVAPRVVNEGSIKTPEGQAILAAGKTVYLYAPLDLAQRGLLVAVDNFSDETLAQIKSQVDDAVTNGDMTDSERPEALGTVENAKDAKVLADKGTINLVGAAIRQKGQLTATTAVKGKNGAIFLSAMKNTAEVGAAAIFGDNASQYRTDKVRIASNTGSIELAAGSVTEVLPSTEGLVLSDAEVTAGKIGVSPDEVRRVIDKPVAPAAVASTASEQEKAAYEIAKAKYDTELKHYEKVLQQASDTFYRSRIDIIGKDITLQAGAVVQAPAGEVNILAATEWAGSSLLRSAQDVKKDDSRIVMEAGAKIDVSGLDNLRLPASRNQLEGRLFSIELADSPLQRDGVIYRANLLADARRSVTIGDVTGLYNEIRYSAAEYATAGGLLRMQAQGSLAVAEDADIDFSGGKVTYDAGTLVSSLLFRNGAITRIEDANRNFRYDTLVSDPSKATPEDIQRLGFADPGKSAPQVLEEQVVGMSAGTAQFSAPTMSLKGKLDGSVTMSEVQRISGDVAERTGDAAVTKSFDALVAQDREVKRSLALTSKPYLYTSLKPTAGWLVLGQHGQESNGAPATTTLSGIQVNSHALDLPTLDGTLNVSADLLNAAGLAGLTLYAQTINFGTVGTDDSPADQPALQLASGGSFEGNAISGLTFKGSVKTAGGSITLLAQEQGADVLVGSGSRLDASATVRDERMEAPPANDGVALKGGTVKVVAARSATFEAGSEVDVSGSTWRNAAGSLKQGAAGTVDLKVNNNYVDITALDGSLVLNATLSAFDASNGGTLKLGGLPAVTVGGESDGAFSIGSQLYADRGFGQLDVNTLGDVAIAPGARIQPKLVNKVPSASRLALADAALYSLKQLDDGQRQPFKLNVSTNAPAAGKMSNITLGQSAVVDVGLGGRISMSAGGSIDLLGTLQALGGQVNVGLLGVRGSPASGNPEDQGYVEDQRIYLGAGALIDVSGAVKSDTINVGSASREVGDVLAGGTITLGGVDGTAVRGQLLMDEAATLRLNGASGLLNRDASSNKSQVSAAAGTLNIMSTDGFQLLGKIEAQAPNASVAGGTINIALSQEGRSDAVLGAGQKYPTEDAAGKRSIRITGSQTQAQALAADGLKFGEGVVSAEVLNGSGFDRINMRADESIQLNAGANFQASDERGRLQSVVLNASVIDVADGAAHTVQAHHVRMGPQAKLADSRPLALPQVVAASERAAKGELGGAGSLDVQAGLIEVAGDTAVLGVDALTLNATLSPSHAAAFDRSNGEVRFLGQASNTSNDLTGQLSFTGQLNVVAGQVYASTLSDASIQGFASDGSSNGGTLTITAPSSGSSSQTPLSALAKLRMRADAIQVDGTVRQPVGTIDIQANKLTLTERAHLSVSADGTQVPVGSTLNQTQWVYATQGTVANGSSGQAIDLAPANNPTVTDLSQLPVNKQIILNGDTLTLSSESSADARAGGDLLAWEFKQGVGGSTDTYLRKGVFAVLPTYSYDFAPFDTEMRATTQKLGSGLQEGDQVSISTDNGVLGAGTYTLMDARYGILPGAVLVSASSLNISNPLTSAITNDDGSVIVSGYKTSTGSQQNGGGNQRVVLNLEPKTTFDKKSEILLTSGNAYQTERAKRSGDPLVLPGDAGRISLQSSQAFDWAARFNLAGKSDENLKAGQFDLAMPDMVVQADTTQAKPSGAMSVSMAQLNALGAESVLLGGVRTNKADGSITIERKANSVRFQADTDADGTLVSGSSNVLRTPGEMLAVAQDSLVVDNGLSIEANGADTGAKRRYVVQGDGAALQVGYLANTDISAANVTGADRGRLVVGSNDAPGQVTLKGNAVQLDATKGLAVDKQTVIDAATFSLGAERLAVGEDALASVADGTVEVTGNLLAAANRAKNLKLRAYTSIDLRGAAQLGAENLTLLTLDAPQLLGAGQATDTAVVSAQNVVLTNSTGRSAAAPLEAGASKLLVKATPVLQDGRTGGITVAKAEAGQRLAFTEATLDSTGDIVFDGLGTTVAQGDVTLRAARITATSTADQRLNAAGTLTIERATTGKSAGESLGAAGSLALEAQRIVQKGIIDIESGRLNMLGRGASGQADTVVFAEGSETRVDGRLRQLSDTFAVASGGGKIVAEAQSGRLVLDGLLSAAAPEIPAGVSGDSPYAGTVSLKATGSDADAAVVVGNNARINLEAALGKGGSLRIDARQLRLDDAASAAAASNSQVAQNGLNKLMQASANASGLSHREVNVRVREGDVSLNTSVKAAMVILTADGGKLDMGFNALIDATAPQGGVVQLYANNDLTVQTGAQVLAQSTRDGANGGDVLLASSEGQVWLGKATIKADSAGDQADGRIVIRAAQTQDSSGNYTGDVNVAQLASAPTDPTDAALTLQAGQIDIEAVRVYTDAPDAAARHTRLNNGNSSGQTWGLTTLANDAAAFATDSNKANALAKLGLTDRPEAHVKAGVEVRALGNLDVGSGADMDLSKLRPGGEPLMLTVRAAGDINVNSTLSDGFTGTTSATLAPQAGDAASMRLTAGADLDSANVLATQADTSQGHVTLAGGKFIRTTAGSIDVNASGDVRLMAPKVLNTVQSSAIYVAGRLSTLDEGESFATSAATNKAYTNAKKQFTERGGRLSIDAGGNVGSYVLGKSAELLPQQITQMTGNYFYHGGSGAFGGTGFSDTPVAYWTALGAFQQGFGSFGGGNIRVSAGSDISNVPVVSPTNARAVTKADGTTYLKELNGGNIDVLAGGNVDGGVYLLGRGQGRIAADGAINEGEKGSLPSAAGIMLGLMDGQWDVSATNDVSISNVFNPTALPFGVNNSLGNLASGVLAPGSYANAFSGLNGQTQASVYFTYGADAGVSLASLRGDVNWASNLDAMQGMLKSSPVEAFNVRTASELNVANYMAPIMSITSLQGNVNMASDVTMVTSEQSDLNVFAGGSLSLNKLHMLYASDVSSLPSLGNLTFLTGSADKNRTLQNFYKNFDPVTAFASADSNQAIQPVSDAALPDRITPVHLVAGQDVVFTGGANGGFVSNRSASIAAGRDVISPKISTQNIKATDVSTVSAGRDIVGAELSSEYGQINVSGPGALGVEAGRDIRLNSALGVFASGNLYNDALPKQSAKITLSAGNARTVNMDQLLAQHGKDAALRNTIDSALLASGLPAPGAANSWSEVSFDVALAAFRQLQSSRQNEAVTRYLTARFVTLYLPQLAGQPEAYYRSNAFLQRKQEAMWQQIIALAGQAVGIAVSSNAQEEAKRAEQRKALFAQAASVADLAGYGVSFDRVGDIDLAKAKVHNLGQGGGSVLGQVDDSQGGIDVIAAGQVAAGLPSAAGNPAGFINFDGGSFRSLTGGDFLAGDQKTIVVGRGNVYIYTTDGSIDSGKGSNTAAAKPLPIRRFDAATGQVITVGQPPTSGSGFQAVEAPADVETKIGLYAPNGEIRALDAFITGSKVELVSPVVKGADNIANSTGAPAAPPPAVSLSPAPKLSDADTGAAKAADTGAQAKQAEARSQLTVELLGFGGDPSGAGEEPCTASNNAGKCKSP